MRGFLFDFMRQERMRGNRSKNMANFVNIRLFFCYWLINSKIIFDIYIIYPNSHYLRILI